MKSPSIIKNIIICTLLLLLMPVLATAQNVSEESGKAYQEGDFNKAVELLEAEMKAQKEKGLESAGLYYNLGNAYFRDNEVAKALLYYEKALLINPGDRDIRHNIEYARTRIEDKIVSVDTFFLQSWFEGIQNMQSSNAWANLAIVLFLIFMVSLGFFFFTKHIKVKKAVFYVGIIAFAFLIFANIFSVRQKNKLTNRDTAIIMAGSVSVKNSPDNSSKELFIIHSGTKVKINKEDGKWMEIEIENGNVGWMTRDQLEII